MLKRNVMLAATSARKRSAAVKKGHRLARQASAVAAGATVSATGAPPKAPAPSPKPPSPPAAVTSAAAAVGATASKSTAGGERPATATTSGAAAVKAAQTARPVLPVGVNPVSFVSSASSSAAATTAKLPPLVEEESFKRVLEVFRAVTEPFSDLDETISVAPRLEDGNEGNDVSAIGEDPSEAVSSSGSGSEGSSSQTPNAAAAAATVQGEENKKGGKPQTLAARTLAQEAAAGAARVAKVSHSKATVLTYRGFAASLQCPKKFYLLQNRPDLAPRLSIGEAVYLDDSVGFNELARRWDRLQFGSKAIVINEKDYDAAVQHTEDVITNYFATMYASLGDQAPTLTIHRPAFAAPFGLNRQQLRHGEELYPLVLRARPCVLRYRPKDNQWTILESQATVDPLGTAARAAQCLQRIHFSMLAFRYWITQPHIPIAVRKRFLDIDLAGVNEENRKGHNLEDSARVAAPIDLKRSGILHIRQFFPGPATLLDCDPPRLVKFIQRLSLEELLQADHQAQSKPSYHYHHQGSAFDLSHLEGLDPAIVAMLNDLGAAQAHAMRYQHARSPRSLKQKDLDEHELFEKQQRLMEALLRFHTLKLVEKAKDAKQVERWTSFASETPDGLVQSTDAQLEEHRRRAAADGGGGVTATDDASAAAEGSGKGSKRGRKGKKKSEEAVAASTDETEAAAAAAGTGVGPLDTPLVPIVPCFSENLGVQCSRGEVCPFFAEGMCLPQKVANPLAERDNHLFTLPSSAVSKKVTWWSNGLRTVRDVVAQCTNGTLKLTAPQLRYARAVTEGHIAINPKEIDAFFAKLRYPVFIIDFEATQFALPPFEKVVAYQSIPFQFSMDVFQHDILTETPTHYDFLHFGKGYSPNVDPRKPCIAELMRIVKLEREKKKAAMESEGELERIRKEEEEAALAAAAAEGKAKPKRAKKPPKVTRNNPLEQPLNPYDGCFIAHFASFEKSCLEKLGQLEERYKEDIKHFYFLDTMDLIKKGFIHPNANGSNSLKKVLPAVCPDFQYGVFGSEGDAVNDEDGVTSAGAGGDDGSGAGGGRQDEQRGENAMGVYRLWYHQEGGGTLQDLQRASQGGGGGTGPHHHTSAAVMGAAESGGGSFEGDGKNLMVSKDMRERVWSTLRIQLLEYCSLDTKALYEIMREIWKERQVAQGMRPVDKSGWVYMTPTPREISF